MILIADSGASKTDWACVDRHSNRQIRFTSQGYNPNFISEQAIIDDLRAAKPSELDPLEVDEIYFYGAGVTELQYPLMRRVLLTVFPAAELISIAMDTLASCRALLQREPGFAAILGTGANSCLYDGCNEGLNVDSCGFILGDDGSGANLGKRMITDYIRRNMPPKVYREVGRALGKNNDELLDQIYTKPFPNRFCAQYAIFIQDHYDFDPYFRNLTTESFRDFFRNVVTHYPNYRSYEFNAVGSIAYFHRPLLEPVVAEFGMKMGKIMRAPMDGLIKYHLQNA